LALKPDEFYRLTPTEFNWLLLGYIYRQRREEEVRAIAVSYLINGRPKSGAMRPEKILGRMMGPKFDEVDTNAYRWRDPRTSRNPERVTRRRR
jgi:hypothetical protein